MNISKNGYISEPAFLAKTDSLKKIYSSLPNEIIASHFGQFDQDKINSLSGLVEHQLQKLATNKKVTKKIFNIIIETLQNIVLHGEKDSNGIQLAYFMIGKKGHEYNIHSGNLVKSLRVEKLNKRLNSLKSLNDTDLKKEYLEVLSNGELSYKGGAGLGFITIALKSEGNVDFDFEDINKNYSLFSLYTKVKD